MAPLMSNLLRFSFISSILGSNLVYGQLSSGTSTTASVLTATIAGQVVTYSPEFTVPASADEGATLLPNIQDPQAVDAQTVCPGYTATDVVKRQNGFSAALTLAGDACK
jgi:alpha-glucosidase